MTENQNTSLNGKVALITGAAGGIGAATAKKMHAAGARLLLSDINVEAGKALQAMLGEGSLFVAHDVTDKAQWQGAVAVAVDTWGRLDILVNNAGTISVGALEDVSESEFRRAMDVNVLSAMLGTQAVMDAMTAQKGGAIVNISSCEGLEATNGLSAYIASKWAMRGFTKACAMELGPRGIRVNSIHPGGVNTAMGNPEGLDAEAFDKPYKQFPAQRGCQPEEIADAVVFLSGDGSRYCMGAELAVDGGMTLGHFNEGLPGAPA